MDARLDGLGAASRIPAPAKLNLFLHVLGRREDGYHRLQTYFQLLDFGDELDIEPLPGGGVELTDEVPGVAVEDNLLWRAAQALRQASGCRLGARIGLVKRVPVGGGLGGGSSNAASCLVALNRLWGLEYPLEQLAAIGVTLGADVPVFIHGRSAFAEGIGEELYPLPREEAWYCVVTPDCAVSTAAVFTAPELTRNTPRMTISDFAAGRAAVTNDCWPVVSCRYPAVREACNWLSQFGEARLSGTGASVFIECENRQRAQQLVSRTPLPWRGVVARGINVSPLHDAVANLSVGA